MINNHQEQLKPTSFLQLDEINAYSLNEFEFRLTTSLINGIINDKLEDNEDNKLFPFENAFANNKIFKCIIYKKRQIW